MRICRGRPVRVQKVVTSFSQARNRGQETVDLLQPRSPNLRHGLAHRKMMTTRSGHLQIFAQKMRVFRKSAKFQRQLQLQQRHLGFRPVKRLWQPNSKLRRARQSHLKERSAFPSKAAPTKLQLIALRLQHQLHHLYLAGRYPWSPLSAKVPSRRAQTTRATHGSARLRLLLPQPAKRKSGRSA